MLYCVLQENAALALRLEELQDDIQSTETEKRYKISTSSHCHQKDNFIYTLYRFLLKKLMSFKNAEPVKTRSPPKRLVTRSLTTQSTISPSSTSKYSSAASRQISKASLPSKRKPSTPPRLIHVKPSPSRSNSKAQVQKKVEKASFDVEAPFMSSSSDSDDDDFTGQKVAKETNSEVKKGAGKGEGRWGLSEGEGF